MTSLIVTNSKLPSLRFLLEYELDLASERKLMPVLSASLVAWGYTTGLRRFVPFSYQALGAIIANGRTCFLLNEGHVSKQTGRLLERLGPQTFLRRILTPAKQSAHQAIEAIQRVKTDVARQPMTALPLLIDAYGEFLTAIGVYNCLNRLATTQTRLPFSAATIQRIAQDRDAIGTYYPQIEKLLTTCVLSAGRRQGIDGDLLRYMTATEIRKWLTGGALKPSERARLRQRRTSAVYLWLENKKKEYVISGQTARRMIERRVVSRAATNNILHGQSAFPGHVRGTVFLFISNRRPPRSAILVTSMTHPNDLPIVRTCRAIITNEGGILSHAAVVARELKIPCIIGTKIATQIFKNGDRVEVDATKGIVQKL